MSEIERVLRAYADAWSAGDLQAVIAAYHEQFTLHYSGESPLASAETQMANSPGGAPGGQACLPN